jgi:hypothetical protein
METGCLPDFHLLGQPFAVSVKVDEDGGDFLQQNKQKTRQSGPNSK